MPAAESLRTGAAVLIGGEEAVAMLGGLAERMANPEEIFVGLFKVLELAELTLFHRLAPRFDLTGATMLSLTEADGMGAIREIHGAQAKFGTSVWYAKFLRRIDGPSGKPKGRKRVGKNLVLKITKGDRQAALRTYARYLVGLG